MPTEPGKKHLVWLDVDPGLSTMALLVPLPLLTCRPTTVLLFHFAGHDDAMALILAGYSPMLELLGVSTVAGNQSVEKMTDNALRVLAAAGLPHIDVVAGAARPLMRPAPILCPEIHGETGLDGPYGGPVLPAAPHAALAGKAVIHMAERLMAAHARLKAEGRGQERVKLVATAALTNVALLLSLYPEIVDLIEVRVMANTFKGIPLHCQTACQTHLSLGSQVYIVCHLVV
jgi:purine nucleosidase